MTTPSEGPHEPVWYSPDQLQQIVQAFVEKERGQATAQLANMQAQIDAMSKSLSGNVPTSITEHGGGHGTTVHETWSQREQELARAAHEAELIASAAVKIAEPILPYIPGL